MPSNTIETLEKATEAHNQRSTVSCNDTDMQKTKQSLVAAAGFQTGAPIVFGILKTNSMQQALEWAGIKSNLGWSCAMNALEKASLVQQIRPVNPLHQMTGQSLEATVPSVPISLMEDCQAMFSAESWQVIIGQWRTVQQLFDIGSF